MSINDSGGSRPSDKGSGVGGGGHPDPEIRRDGPFDLKIRGAGPFPASSTAYAADQNGTF